MLSAASAALLLGAVSQARPTTYTSANGGGAWSSAGSWSPGSGPPAAGDTAIISQSNPITVSSSVGAATVTVNASGVLTVNASGVVTAPTVGVSGQLLINNTGQVDADDVTVNSGGLIKLDGSSGQIAELLFSSSAPSPTLTVDQSNGLELLDNARVRVAKTMTTFAGTGSLWMEDNAVEVALDTDNSTPVTLTVSLPVHGKGIFKKHDAGSAAANLVNSGEFKADVSGNFTLDASLDSVDDTASSDGCSAPRWAVDTASANLIFNKAATALNGGFFIDNGTLQVNQSIQTDAVDETNSGFLKFMGGGAINCAAGKSFRFSGNCGGATCTPTSPMSGNNSCP